MFMHIQMLEKGIKCKRMNVLIDAFWDQSHRNLLAFAYTKMDNLLRHVIS